MNLKTFIAATLVALLAVPAFAADEGSGNAEQQTQPTPNRGGTAGGPAHGPDHPKNAPEGSAQDHTAKPHQHSDGSKH